MTPRGSILILLVVTAAMTLLAASAQEKPAESASRAISEKVSSSGRTAGVNDPGYSSTATAERVRSFDPAAATQAWLESVPRNEREKSNAYFEGGYWLIFWNFVLTAAISVLLLSSRFSARLRDFSERITKIKNVQIACYAILYLLLVYALSFPLNLYENFFREHHYGLATQSFAPWFREQLLGLALTLAGGTLAGGRSLRRLSAGPAHVVDLGDYRHAYFLGNPCPYRAGLHRTAL